MYFLYNRVNLLEDLWIIKSQHKDIMLAEYRISIFVSLPIRSLDKLTLQKQLESIGKAKNAGDTPATAAE